MVDPSLVTFKIGGAAESEVLLTMIRLPYIWSVTVPKPRVEVATEPPLLVLVAVFKLKDSALINCCYSLSNPRKSSEVLLLWEAE